MANLPETSAWEPGIHQLEESDRAKAGPGGILNIPPWQLANRTRYLKEQLDAYNGLLKSGELPFSNINSALSAVTAGKVPEGALLSVRSDNPLFWVDEYKNVAGELVSTGKHLPSDLLILNTNKNQVREYMTNNAAEYDLSVGLIPDGNAVYIREIDTQFLASEYINIDGVLTASGRKRISQESVAPFLKLLELITYISDDEFESSGIDSAGMDSDGRWLWKWIADVFWLKNLVVTGELTAAKAEVAEINAGQVTINGIPVKSVDNVDYLDPDEYAGALFDSAVVSENLRWLMGWIGDRAFFKNVTLGSLLARIIDVDSLTIAGVPYQSYLADASEFEGSGLVSGVLDESNRIISGLTEDGEAYQKQEHDFRAFVDDKNLKVLNIHTARMAVFATDTDFTNVRNESDYFVFNSPSSDAIAGEIMSPYNAWLPVSEYGRKTLALWGHSFIGNNTSFSLKLSQLTGYPAYNFGRSGATSVAIALRNGAYTKNYQPAGGVIPATGDIALTPAQPGPLQIVGDVAAEDGLKCSLAGIDGVINWTGTEMVFTRSEAGAAVIVTGPTPLQVYPYTTREIGDIPLATRYDQHREAVNILWIGRNNASSIMQILSDMKAITDKLARQNRRFVVLPEFPIASEVIGTTGQAQVMYLNSELKRLYPGNYCEINGVDLLLNFKNHYNPDYPQDVEDIANGITPTSLRQDTLHPSQSLRPNALFIGTEVNAIFVHQFMVSKGWL
ncbi:hypothetical protein [Klebsiella spallanzanii]|uniref:Flagellar biosynthesis, cell-distal portion of basal-body rod n=1 Tax=Klebsiella spallanzanii TaxID=2587528 RepID=A0A564NAM7_9ENTR|nr:hypothetical protein [Klebsiella spallanzanii]VUT03109.1 hypothetical protein SB6408_02072 [Klebsiella spallanzanii]